MTQRFIDNWNAATVAPLSASGGGVIEDLAPPERLAEITDLLGRDEFYMELTLAAVGGGVETAWEIVRVFGDGTLQRGVNSQPLDWPAGTRIAARFTAAAATAAATSPRGVVRVEENLLVVDEQGITWRWEPDSDTCTLQMQAFSFLDRPQRAYDTDIELDCSWAPQVLNIDVAGAWAFLLPDGATAERPEQSPYIVTLPGETTYRLRLRGSPWAATIEIVDIGQYYYP